MQLTWPWQDRKRRFSWLKASTFALMLFPAIRTAYLVGAGDTVHSGQWFFDRMAEIQKNPKVIEAYLGPGDA